MSDETPLEPQSPVPGALGLPPSVDKDRRATIRRPCLRIGKVIVADSETMHPCVLRDLSTDGARIKLREDIDLPEYILVYDMKQISATPARIVWRDGEMMGVAWIGPSETVTMGATKKLSAIIARSLSKDAG